VVRPHKPRPSCGSATVVERERTLSDGVAHAAPESEGHGIEVGQQLILGSKRRTGDVTILAHATRAKVCLN